LKLRHVFDLSLTWWINRAYSTDGSCVLSRVNTMAYMVMYHTIDDTTHARMVMYFTHC